MLGPQAVRWVVRDLNKLGNNRQMLLSVLVDSSLIFAPKPRASAILDGG
jgi:hypothetical protein